MGEEKILAIYIAVLLGISIAAVILILSMLTRTGPVYADYRAVIYPNLTLVEEYIYSVGEQGKTMLYRFWEAPLLRYRPEPPAHSEPHIVLLRVECPERSIAYIKDFVGKVYIFLNRSAGRWSDESVAEAFKVIAKKAYNNEAGCYFPNGVPVGEHRVEFVFQLNPPAEVDERYAHLNIKLADEHVPYRSVEIELREFEPVALHVHVPKFAVENRGGAVAISGSSPSNTLIEVEFVVQRSFLEENAARLYTREVRDVLSATSWANMIYLVKYSAVKFVYYAFAVALVAFPILLVIRYYRVGREKKYVVPEYLSYIPNKERKPWQVNLLFHRDAVQLDENAFYATILDFARRGLVEILKADKDDVVLRIREVQGAEELDGYESNIYEFLKKYSRDGVFSFREFSEKIKNEVKNNRRTALKYKGDLDSVLRTTRDALTYARQFIEPRKPVPGHISLILLAVCVCTIVFYRSFYPAATIMFSLVLIGELGISYTMPSYVFGRWKEDFYRERLEWQAFRNLLKDLAKLDKYAPQDMVIWKEWLIYATALGVADRVVEAMEKLRVPIPVEAMVPIAARPMLRDTVRTVQAATAKGEGRGGGFGAGGGFGGGGAGVR